MIGILIAIYGLIIFLEVPALVANHWYKDLSIFIVLFIIGVYMSLAQFYSWPLGNPFQFWIEIMAAK